MPSPGCLQPGGGWSRRVASRQACRDAGACRGGVRKTNRALIDAHASRAWLGEVNVSSLARARVEMQMQCGRVQCDRVQGGRVQCDREQRTSQHSRHSTSEQAQHSATHPKVHPSRPRSAPRRRSTAAAGCARGRGRMAQCRRCTCCCSRALSTGRLMWHRHASQAPRLRTSHPNSAAHLSRQRRQTAVSCCHLLRRRLRRLGRWRHCRRRCL